MIHIEFNTQAEKAMVMARLEATAHLPVIWPQEPLFGLFPEEEDERRGPFGRFEGPYPDPCP